LNEITKKEYDLQLCPEYDGRWTQKDDDPLKETGKLSKQSVVSNLPRASNVSDISKKPGNKVKPLHSSASISFEADKLEEHAHSSRKIHSRTDDSKLSFHDSTSKRQSLQPKLANSNETLFELISDSNCDDTCLRRKGRANFDLSETPSPKQKQHPNDEISSATNEDCKLFSEVSNGALRGEPLSSGLDLVQKDLAKLNIDSDKVYVEQMIKMCGQSDFLSMEQVFSKYTLLM
jgi:hypothetical protein